MSTTFLYKRNLVPCFISMAEGASPNVKTGQRQRDAVGLLEEAIVDVLLEPIWRVDFPAQSFINTIYQNKYKHNIII